MEEKEIMLESQELSHFKVWFHCIEFETVVIIFLIYNTCISDQYYWSIRDKQQSNGFLIHLHRNLFHLTRPQNNFYGKIYN